MPSPSTSRDRSGSSATHSAFSTRTTPSKASSSTFLMHNKKRSSSATTNVRRNGSSNDLTTRFPPDPSIPPPSLSQIAMGLHLSRTPHLRKPKHPPPPLPPPPARSALKSPPPKMHARSFSMPLELPSASHSSSTLASRSSMDPRSWTSRLTGNISQKSNILSHFLARTDSRSNSASDTATEHDRTGHKPKKSVRFSSSTLDLNTPKEG